MKTLRSTWVIVTSGAVIYLFYRAAETRASLHKLLENPDGIRAAWFSFGMWAAIPILGILLEVFGSRFAKWVNVGFFGLLGLAFAYIGLMNWSDYVIRIYFYSAIPAFALAGVNYLLYRGKRRSLDKLETS
jgi:hypothetical protein